MGIDKLVDQSLLWEVIMSLRDLYASYQKRCSWGGGGGDFDSFLKTLWYLVGDKTDILEVNCVILFPHPLVISSI